MDRAELERMKEEEKQHLREIMGLKKKLGEAERKAKIMNALNNIGVSSESQATYDEMMEKLTRSNIDAEVRMDMALENAGISPVATAPNAAAPQTPALSEEEMQKLRAAELVKQMKLEFGGPMMPLSEPSASAVDLTLDRTIGRMPKASSEEKASEETDDTAAPDRTIGRAVKRGIWILNPEFLNYF